MSLVDLELDVVATVRLANPPLNLITRELIADLDRALSWISSSGGVRAVVVAGNERAFSAGSDVSEFEALRGHALEGKILYEKQVYRELAELAMPTIAACEGDALGGGLELAMCCDLRVASEKARFGMPEVGLGVIPGSGGTQMLPRIVGLGRAKQMILTGEVVDADEAIRCGLVGWVVPTGQAEETARVIADRIAAHGPTAIREAKTLLDGAFDRPLQSGLEAETLASDRVFATDDMIEGARAFLEKRRPEFRGR